MALFFASYQFSAVLAFAALGVVHGSLALGGVVLGIFALYWTLQYCRGQWFFFISPRVAICLFCLRAREQPLTGAYVCSRRYVMWKQRQRLPFNE